MDQIQESKRGNQAESLTISDVYPQQHMPKTEGLSQPDDNKINEPDSAAKYLPDPCG